MDGNEGIVKLGRSGVWRFDAGVCSCTTMDETENDMA